LAATRGGVVPASIIENDGEVERWFEQERPYSYMIEQYETKYHKKTTIAYWSKQRDRRGYPPRNVRDKKLMPWRIANEDHLHTEDPTNLRREARLRAGKTVGEDPEYQAKALRELEQWKERLDAEGAVVHYDPDTDEGWFWVPRREGVDLDLIREPDND
jgi:hypothetical protein